MSQQPNARTTTQRVNAVDVDVPEGKEGWREYSVNDILSEIDRVVRASKEPAMVAARVQSEGLYVMRIMERFDQTPAFKNRISLLKKVALGLDAAGKKNIGEMLASIELMQQAASSKEARAIEFEFGQAFNKRVAPDLVAEASPEQIAALKADFVNRTGAHAPRGNDPLGQP
jgi:hypothetical protein